MLGQLLTFSACAIFVAPMTDLVSPLRWFSILIFKYTFTLFGFPRNSDTNVSDGYVFNLWHVSHGTTLMQRSHSARNENEINWFLSAIFGDTSKLLASPPLPYLSSCTSFSLCFSIQLGCMLSEWWHNFIHDYLLPQRTAASWFIYGFCLFWWQWNKWIRSVTVLQNIRNDAMRQLYTVH